MNSPALVKVCERLMSCPAIAYHEELVMDQVDRFCAEHGLAVEADAHGNRIVSLATDPGLPALAFVAHMDHPGFEIAGRIDARRREARFLGGVPDAYFQTGIPLRLHPGDLRARLGERLPGDGRFVIELETPDPAIEPRFAVWELPPFHLAGGRITGRACDDLVGVAAILTSLAELRERGAAVNVRGLITRAEEVGFHGALLLAQSGRVDRATRILSLETSREMPPVTLGAGVILRTGDRASIFDSRFTRFLGEVAASLQSRDPAFRHQRALMSGGTCEGTAFQEYGYTTAALCVALGNYHNCGPDTRIQEEFVSQEDAQGMVQLLVEAALRMAEFDTLTAKLRSRLDQYTAAARQRLEQ